MSLKSPPKDRQPLAEAPPLAVVVSRYNSEITDKLLQGARRAYESRGGKPVALEVVWAPGSFELPFLAMAAAETGRFVGVLALGCLIKGETSHDRYIAEAVADGLMNVSLENGIPVAFGVLTVDTPEQATDRAGGKHGNKGEESMHALLDTCVAWRELDSPLDEVLAVEAMNVVEEAGRRLAAAGASRVRKVSKKGTGGSK